MKLITATPLALLALPESSIAQFSASDLTNLATSVTSDLTSGTTSGYGDCPSIVTLLTDNSKDKSIKMAAKCLNMSNFSDPKNFAKCLKKSKLKDKAMLTEFKVCFEAIKPEIDEALAATIEDMNAAATEIQAEITDKAPTCVKNLKKSLGKQKESKQYLKCVAKGNKLDIKKYQKCMKGASEEILANVNPCAQELADYRAVFEKFVFW